VAKRTKKTRKTGKTTNISNAAKSRKAGKARRGAKARKGEVEKVGTVAWKHLFVDDEHLLEVKNITRRVNRAIKHPQPVLQMDAPWDQKSDYFNYVNVLYDDQEGLFKAWYVVMSYTGQYTDGNRKLAYATSKDGIGWEKPIMNMVEVNGSKKNNYITPEYGTFVPSIMIDPSDVPARRFKMMLLIGDNYGQGAGATAWAKFHVPMCLAYSHDGIQWERPEHVNPVMRGLSDGGWGFAYDQDRRKYMMLTRRVPNLPRDISLYESDDLVNWQDKGRVLVPGDEHDPPSLYNFQSLQPFLYEGFWMGMLAVQYACPYSEGYGVFHKPPDDYPDKRLGIVELQLAYSRDGRQWNRPQDRTAVVPAGPWGDLDFGIVFPGMNPFVMDGETYIYTHCSTWGHTGWEQSEHYDRNNGDVRKQGFGMLAKMPEDHWVSLDAGKREGTVLTKAVGYIPKDLLVNADAEGGYVAAELITPYKEPIKGFSRKECIPVTANGKDQAIRWTSGLNLWDFVEDLRGGLLIRFHVKNAKLYSFSLVLDDPDGTSNRHQQNARWAEFIKHKSDDWGRLSNEPAGGVPPATGEALNC